MKSLLTEWRKYLKEEEEVEQEAPEAEEQKPEEPEEEEKSDFEVHTMYNPETGESNEAQSEEEHNELAAKGFVHVNPEEVRQSIEDEGGAAGLDAIMGDLDAEEEELQKAMMGMPDVGQHKDGDYILGDDDEIKIDEEFVSSLVREILDETDLLEAPEVKDKFDDEVEKRNKKSMKQGLAFLKKEGRLDSFVDSIIDEMLSEDELEEGGSCDGPTQKTTSTAKGKKYMKCIKNPDGKGYIRKHWGQKGTRAAPKGSARNKSFNKRHDCKNAKAGSANKLSCDDW
tara:strand:- start:156 stop:1007 length:852 start_codon:yes stop_codon:yes gene_type:complete